MICFADEVFPKKRRQRLFLVLGVWGHGFPVCFFYVVVPYSNFSIASKLRFFLARNVLCNSSDLLLQRRFVDKSYGNFFRIRTPFESFATVSKCFRRNFFVTNCFPDSNWYSSVPWLLVFCYWLIFTVYVVPGKKERLDSQVYNQPDFCQADYIAVFSNWTLKLLCISSSPVKSACSLQCFLHWNSEG